MGLRSGLILPSSSSTSDGARSSPKIPVIFRNETNSNGSSVWYASKVAVAHTLVNSLGTRENQGPFFKKNNHRHFQTVGQSDYQILFNNTQHVIRCNTFSLKLFNTKWLDPRFDIVSTWGTSVQESKKKHSLWPRSPCACLWDLWDSTLEAQQRYHPPGLPSADRCLKKEDWLRPQIRLRKGKRFQTTSWKTKHGKYLHMFISKLNLLEWYTFHLNTRNKHPKKNSKHQK